MYVEGVRAAVALGTRTILSCESADPVEIFVNAVDVQQHVRPQQHRDLHRLRALTPERLVTHPVLIG